MVEQAGYPDGQAFLTAYNKAESIVRQDQQDMAAWKQRAEGAPYEKPQRKRVLVELRRLEAETNRKPRRPTERRHQMDAG